MDESFDQIKKHTYQYWFEDGLTETIVGGLFVLIGLFVLLQGFVEPGSFLAGISGFAGAILIIIGIWVARSLTASLKERITYPRTGYVSYHQPGNIQRALTGILGGLTAVFFVWLISSFPEIFQIWIPLIEGFAFGLFMFVIGQRTGLLRFYLLTLFAVITGAGLSLYSNSDLIGSGWFFISMGVALIVSGLLVLTRYLRRTEGFSGASNGY